jgi:predicted SprT family Zn-dependent metalloprotease
MTRTLGRCLPERRTVRLSAELEEAPRELVREVLCHELAHVLVHERFGSDVRPHGTEWQELVRKAGYHPQRKMPWVVDGDTPAAPPRRALYEHRCPVCQMVRVARTATPRWQCADCVADGLEGDLVVTRIDGAADDG